MRACKARVDMVVDAVDSAEVERLDVRGRLFQWERTSHLGTGSDMSGGFPPNRTVTPLLELLPQ